MCREKGFTLSSNDWYSHHCRCGDKIGSYTCDSHGHCGLARLHEFRCKLLARGINAEPITNGGDRDELNNHNFCPQEWVPTYNRPWDRT